MRFFFSFILYNDKSTTWQEWANAFFEMVLTFYLFFFVGFLLSSYSFVCLCSWQQWNSEVLPFVCIIDRKIIKAKMLSAIQITASHTNTHMQMRLFHAIDKWRRVENGKDRENEKKRTRNRKNSIPCTYTVKQYRWDIERNKSIFVI